MPAGPFIIEKFVDKGAKDSHKDRKADEMIGNKAQRTRGDQAPAKGEEALHQLKYFQREIIDEVSQVLSFLTFVRVALVLVNGHVYLRGGEAEAGRIIGSGFEFYGKRRGLIGCRGYKVNISYYLRAPEL